MFGLWFFLWLAGRSWHWGSNGRICSFNFLIETENIIYSKNLLKLNFNLLFSFFRSYSLRSFSFICSLHFNSEIKREGQAFRHYSTKSVFHFVFLRYNFDPTESLRAKLSYAQTDATTLNNAVHRAKDTTHKTLRPCIMRVRGPTNVGRAMHHASAITE